MQIWILFNIIALIAFLFVMLFGPNSFFRDSVIGKSYVLITDYIPGIFWNGFQFVVGKERADRVTRFISRFYLQRNPFAQVFYLLLVSGGIYIFFAFIYPRIPESTPSVLVGTIPLSIVLFYTSFTIASWSDPGVVPQTPVKYEYDYVLYMPKQCSTCKIVKPARSKHCRVCDKCIAMADHHCIWINNCVGQNNCRFFLFFLLCNVTGTLHASLLGYYVFCDIYMSVSPLYYRSAPYTQINWYHKLWYLSVRNVEVAAFIFFCFIVFLLLVSFLAYQVYLVSAGVTTNEQNKWEDLAFEIKVSNPLEPLKMGLENFNYLQQMRPIVASTNIVPSFTDYRVTNRKQLLSVSNELSRSVVVSQKDGNQYVVIKSMKQLFNFYNNGFKKNWENILFPTLNIPSKAKAS